MPRVHVQPVTRDRRVTDPSRHLPGRAAGGARPGQATVQAVGQHAHRVVAGVPGTGPLGEESPLATVDRTPRRVRRGPGSPPLPPLADRIGQELRPLHDAGRIGQPFGPLAHQQHVRRGVHHQPRGPDRRQSVPQSGHRPELRRRPHHQGVQRHEAVEVGQSAAAHRVDLGVGLDGRGHRHRRVQRVAADEQIRQRPVAVAGGEGPGGQQSGTPHGGDATAAGRPASHRPNIARDHPVCPYRRDHSARGQLSRDPVRRPRESGLSSTTVPRPGVRPVPSPAPRPGDLQQ